MSNRLNDDPYNLVPLGSLGSILLFLIEVSGTIKILNIVSDVAGLANCNLLVNDTPLPYNGERPPIASLFRMPLPSLSQMSLSYTPYWEGWFST